MSLVRCLIMTIATGTAVAMVGYAASALTEDENAESAKLFMQMASVLQSPRCLNCHTNGDYPRQGDDRHRHTMNVVRGPRDHGAAGLQCNVCHQSTNQEASGVPGAPDWHIAPIEMGWEGLSVGELCRSLSDPARGGMEPAQLVEHFHTHFVRWAWAPGADAHGRPRSRPSIPYDDFIALTEQWVASGARCPG